MTADRKPPDVNNFQILEELTGSNDGTIELAVEFQALAESV